MSLEMILKKYQRKATEFQVTCAKGDIFVFRSVSSKLELDRMLEDSQGFAKTVQGSLTGESFYNFRVLDTASLIKAYLARELFVGYQEDSKSCLQSPDEVGLNSHVSWLEFALNGWQLFDAIASGIEAHVSEQAILQEREVVDEAKKNYQPDESTPTDLSSPRKSGTATPSNSHQKV